MKILMICKHNRFRSKVAEALFNLRNKNKKNKVRSRATQPDYIPVAENVRKALKVLGIKKINRKPRKLMKKDISWADLIVVVADNISLDIPNKKIIKWKIPDTDQSNYKEILKISKIIEKKVRNLIMLVKSNKF